MVRKVFCWLIFGLFGAALALAQTATSVGGTVIDPTGAVIADATVNLLNVGTGAARAAKSDDLGRYQFNQVEPGAYQITASAPGFGKVVVDRVQLHINQPATVPIAFKKVNSQTETVSVEADSSVQVNTSDATLGNVIENRPVVQLPLEARNPTALLALQPGVTYIKDPQEGTLNDPRSGAVNGGKSDQANVLLDGVDVNDQQNRASFTSVLRMPPEAIQEFREITSNPPASLGFSSGAQVTLVTKSGTNAVHGGVYEYNRNTYTEANNFISKEQGASRAALIYNVFGADGGGPIMKDRLFIFGGYEGRRDASATPQYRIVPNSTFRQGTFTYITNSGGTSQLTPAQVNAQAAIAGDTDGEDPAVLAYLQQFPLPQNTGQGDGLNTGEYAFNAKTPFTYNTFITRLDWNVDHADKHQVFFRGNLQNDKFDNGAPEFPGQPPSSVYLDNSKGFAVGYTWLVSQNIVNVVHYGFTREGVANTGTQTAGANTFEGLSPLHAVENASSTHAGGFASAQQLPVNDIREDLTWIKGQNTWGFGTEVFLLRNHYQTDSASFSSAIGDGNWIAADGATLLVPDALRSVQYERQFSNILGLLPKIYNQTQFDINSNPLPQGQTIQRIFSQKHVDFYGDDTWKARPNLTFYAGVRLTIAPPVVETQGYNVQSTTPAGTFMLERAADARAGISQSNVGLLTYDLNKNLHAKNWKTQYDWAPRVSFDWTPQLKGGILGRLLGTGGQSVIRGGYGFLYDDFGQGMIRTYANSVGFADLGESAPNEVIANVPHFTGEYSVPLNSPIAPPTPKGGFPQVVPLGGAQTSTIDTGITAPYSMIANITFERQLPHGFLVQVSYVNRQSRHSLIGEDIATPANLCDAKSGSCFYQAAQALEKLALQGATDVSQIQPIPFFEVLFPGAAGCDINMNCGSKSATPGSSATQGMYGPFYATGGDWTTSELIFDQLCQPACSTLGPDAMWNAQFAANYAYRSVGSGSYNGLQLVLRKAFSNGYQFDVDYTYSHSYDLGSSPESGGAENAIGSILTTWDPKQNWAPSDYDMTNQLSAYFIGQLPFGRGKAFLSNSNRVVNAVLGGWQVTTIVRADSGFPGSVGEGIGWPTVWDFQGNAQINGPVPSTSHRKLGNVFQNPTTAFNSWSPVYAGNIGSRNDVRGTPLFNLDGGLDKTFSLFSIHDNPTNMEFRVEGFNLTNSAPLDIASATMALDNPNDFGLYTTTLTDARQFQAALSITF